MTITKATTYVTFVGQDNARSGQTVRIELGVYVPEPYIGTAPRSGVLALQRDGVEIARADAPSGLASFNFTAPPGGIYNLTAVYSGNDTFQPSAASRAFTSSAYNLGVNLISSFGATPFDCPPPSPSPGCRKSVVQGTGTVGVALSGPNGHPATLNGLDRAALQRSSSMAASGRRCPSSMVWRCTRPPRWLLDGIRSSPPTPATSTSRGARPGSSRSMS